MKPDQVSQTNPVPKASRAGVWSGYYRFVQNYPTFVLGVILLCGFVAVLWHLSYNGNRLIELSSRQYAQSIATAISEFRSVYASEVVQTAGAHGMSITHDYQDQDNAIPLPATLSMLLGERIGERAAGVTTRLYSPYPFPWRRDKGGLRDAFNRDAWQQLNQTPDTPVSRVETMDGRAYLRYAIADRMHASCVHCHNTHQDTPKKGWQVGDVRGVLEVNYPLDTAVAESRAFLRETAVLMILLALLGVMGTGVAIGGLRRTTRQLEWTNQQVTSANHELANQKKSLHQQNTELGLAKAQTETAMATLEKHTQELEAARLAALNMMQDMQAARSEAETAARAKSEFLANMSHEIRTPMTAILGYTDILVEAHEHNDPSDFANAINTIQRNGQHLLTVINDILDLSKIEAGKMAVERIPCSPCEIAAEVGSLMRPRAIEKGLDFRIQYDSPIPETIQSDPTRLRQILINLVGNAVKFTKEGGVRLVSKLVNQADGGSACMVFQVIDTGIGMTAEQQTKLFKAFSQADTSMTRNFGGTGLGLMISQRLAEKLGGDITVDSRSGQGSVFTLTIDTGPLDGVPIVEHVAEAVLGPTEDQRKPTAASQAPTELNCRVLLAEDGPDNQRLISLVLKKAGAQVTVAENGLIACNKVAEAAEAGKPFDVILMDMQMPTLDGYGATRTLRENGFKGPIIALTAHAMSGDRDRCLEAGCDDYDTKPINRAKLIALVHQWSTKPTPSAS